MIQTALRRYPLTSSWDGYEGAHELLITYHEMPWGEAHIYACTCACPPQVLGILRQGMHGKKGSISVR